MLYALIIISALSAAIFIFIDCAKNNRHASLIAKATASFFFVTLGFYSLFSTELIGKANERFGLFIVLGLVAGLIGDILLAIFDPAQTKKTGVYLPAGMVAFGIEHILIIASVTVSTGYSPLYMLLCVLVGGAAISSVIMIGGRIIAKLQFGHFMLHSWLYAGILSGALVYYITLAIRGLISLPFVIGMALFFISDIVLSMIYFGGKNKSSLFTALNLSTYYAGQIIFAATVGSVIVSAIA